MQKDRHTKWDPDKTHWKERPGMEPKQAGFEFQLLSLASCVTSESPRFLNLYNGAKPLTTGMKPACPGLRPEQLGSTHVVCPRGPPDTGDP